MKKIICSLFLFISSFQISGATAPVSSPASQPTHGFSTYEDLKYPADFAHFDYTNPNAPKGGTLRLGDLGTFDNLNPYIVKGTPPSTISLTTATLLQETGDRPGESYAYGAESVELAPDRSWVVFRLNPKATFSNGDPITANDVIWVFETLRTKGLPMFRTYYKNIHKVEKLDEHSVKFSFNSTKNRELPLILGQLPLLSKKHYEKHPFAETSLTPAPSSGPYVVESIEAGRSLTYKRVENWWGESVPSQRGRHNFTQIKVDYYLENNALFEGFKAGQYDFRHEVLSKNWATAYTFPAYLKGFVKREELKYARLGGTYGLFFNTRRPLFGDVRVRKALTLLFDFPWINKHLFYGSYKRNKSYYPNSDFEASGLPGEAEKAILQPYQDQLPKEVLHQEFDLPTTQIEGDKRALQMQALSLLKEAGYEVKDEVLVNAKTGEPFTFTILNFDKSVEKIMLNFAASLKRIGIALQIRSLDLAAYQARVDNLDYDMILAIIGQSPSLGNEQRDYFGSERANIPGTRNYAGIQNPVIDQLIEQLIVSKDYPSLVNYAKVLDRILLWGYYMIPAWHNDSDRIAYWDRFSRPQIYPKYQGADVLSWWFDPEKDAKLSHKPQGNTPSPQHDPSLWQRVQTWFSKITDK